MFYNKATLWQGGGGGGGGSISFVSGGNSGGYGVASVTVPITGTQAGDTVFVLAHATRNPNTSAPPVACSISGYSLAAQRTESNNYAGLFWKRLTAADSSVVVTSNTVNNCTSAVVLVMRGCNTSPFGATPSFEAGVFASSQIDPPQVTPTVAGSIVLAMGSIAVDNTIVVIQSLSATYNNPQINNSPAGSTPAARCGICWKPWVSGVMDPGAFSLNYGNNGLGTLSLSAIVVP